MKWAAITPPLLTLASLKEERLFPASLFQFRFFLFLAASPKIESSRVSFSVTVFMDWMGTLSVHLVFCSFWKHIASHFMFFLIDSLLMNNQVFFPNLSLQRAGETAVFKLGNLFALSIKKNLKRLGPVLWQSK